MAAAPSGVCRSTAPVVERLRDDLRRLLRGLPSVEDLQLVPHLDCDGAGLRPVLRHLDDVVEPPVVDVRVSDLDISWLLPPFGVFFPTWPSFTRGPFDHLPLPPAPHASRPLPELLGSDLGVVLLGEPLRIDQVPRGPRACVRVPRSCLRCPFGCPVGPLLRLPAPTPALISRRGVLPPSWPFCGAFPACLAVSSHVPLRVRPVPVSH